MTNSTEIKTTTTTFLVTVKDRTDDKSLFVLNFPTFTEATEYMVEAQKAGFTTALGSMSGNVLVQAATVAPRIPADVPTITVVRKRKTAKPAAEAAPKKGKSVKKAATPATPVESDKSEETSETATYRLSITTKEGKIIKVKGQNFAEVKGFDRASKYADRCRAQGKVVQIVRL